MSKKQIKGRGIVPGIAEGVAMVSRETIQGWSGIDKHTGKVVECGHPLEGKTLAGSILVVSGGKGSTGWASHMHLAVLKGIGPAGFVFPKMDSRTGVGAVVANVPAVTDLEEDPFETIRTGDLVRVDGTKGIVEILEQED